MSATVRQLQVLAVLKKAEPGTSLRELGLKLRISHVSVSLMLKRLVGLGLITTERTLTEAGVAALRTAAADLRASLADVA